MKSCEIAGLISLKKYCRLANQTTDFILFPALCCNLEIIGPVSNKLGVSFLMTGYT